MKSKFLLIIFFRLNKNKYYMDVNFFKSLDEKLKKQIDEGVKLDADQPKGLVLRQVAESASLVLQYRNIMYRVQLATEVELIRSLYFSGIEEILATIYENYYSFPLEKKVHLYTRVLPKPKSTVEKNAALKAIHEKLPMLQTNWLNYYNV